MPLAYNLVHSTGGGDTLMYLYVYRRKNIAWVGKNRTQGDFQEEELGDATQAK